MRGLDGASAAHFGEPPMRAIDSDDEFLWYLVRDPESH